MNFNLNKESHNFFIKLLASDFSNELHLKLRTAISSIKILKMMFYL